MSADKPAIRLYGSLWEFLRAKCIAWLSGAQNPDSTADTSEAAKERLVRWIAASRSLT